MSFLTDGYQTLIGLSVVSSIFPLAGRAGGGPAGVLREREVQPCGLNGGGPIDTVTMRNVAWRTASPKSLVGVDDITVQCQYDPLAFRNVSTIINVNQYITITFPDSSALVIYGWVDTFTPISHKEGEFPLAEVKIHISNVNAGGVEAGPGYTTTGQPLTALRSNPLFPVNFASPVARGV